MKEEFDYYQMYEDSRFPGKVVVKGFGTYERSSVLAGQTRIVFIDTMTEEEARERYPGIMWGSKFTDPQISLNHLPDRKR